MEKEAATGRSKGPGSLLRLLGPGLVTGAADDDPSGIATYSQAGAQFGYALCWTMFLTLPFMAAIQIISAMIGWQTRRGLARNLAQQLSVTGALRAGRLARGGKHHQHCGRPRRHGGSVAPCHRRASARLCRGLRASPV